MTNIKAILSTLGDATPPTPVTPGLCSAIIPVYRTFDHKRISLAVESLRSQRGIDVEVVIAEESDNPTLADTTAHGAVIYVSVPASDLADGIHHRPGRVRNAAARASHGEFIYNTDGDVLLLNPYYLADLCRAVAERPDLAMYRPPMRRLPLECFDDFHTACVEHGLTTALSMLDTSRPYIATLGDTSIDMDVVIREVHGQRKTILFTSTDRLEYLSDPTNKRRGPKYSTQDLHCGATLARRNHFDIVGGFCESFAAWGCHDADLQWKLREMLTLTQIPYERRFEVLHLDHVRDYFSEEQWERNRQLQETRRADGVITAIRQDRTVYEAGTNGHV